MTATPTISTHVIAAVLAIVVSAIVVSTATVFDQRVLRCGTPIRLVVAALLLMASAWLVSVIKLALWFEVPGAYGPVQFWVGAPEAGAFQQVRVFALFLLILGAQPLAALTLVATLVSLFLKSPTPRWHRCIVPFISIVTFAVGYYLFNACGFFPSA